MPKKVELLADAEQPAVISVTVRKNIRDAFRDEKGDIVAVKVSR